MPGDLIELRLHLLQFLVVPWLLWHWLLLLIAMPPMLSGSVVIVWPTNQLLFLRRIRLPYITHRVLPKRQPATTEATSGHASASTGATATKHIILHLFRHQLVLVLLHHLLNQRSIHLILVHHVVVHVSAWAEGGSACAKGGSVRGVVVAGHGPRRLLRFHMLVTSCRSIVPSRSRLRHLLLLCIFVFRRYFTCEISDLRHEGRLDRFILLLLLCCHRLRSRTDWFMCVASGRR